MGKKKTQEEIIKKFQEIHGDRYSYNNFVYKGAHVKRVIICPEHGDFLQTPNKHSNGQGCPKCGVEKQANKCKISYDELIEKLKKIHNNKYTYPDKNKKIYKNANSKIYIICPDHGEFVQIVSNHKNYGCGCPKCAIEEKSKKFRNSYDKLIEDLKRIHDNKYTYPEKNRKIYKNNKSKIYIVCQNHGEFIQKIHNHKNLKNGCPKCAIKKIAEKQKTPYDILIKELQKIHNYRYLYPEKNRKIYRNNRSKLYVVCSLHGEFRQTVNKHKNQGQGCPKCPVTISKPEQELADYISSLGHKIIQSHRGWCPERPQLEIDIFIPELNLGFEFNGSYWHSLRDKNYHKEKTLLALKNNIKLIHVWEEKWINKPEQVKRMIEKRIANV